MVALEGFLSYLSHNIRDDDFFVFAIVLDQNVVENIKDGDFFRDGFFLHGLFFHRRLFLICLISPYYELFDFLYDLFFNRHFFQNLISLTLGEHSDRDQKEDHSQCKKNAQNTLFHYIPSLLVRVMMSHYAIGGERP